MGNHLKELVKHVSVSSMANGNMTMFVTYKNGTPGFLGRSAAAEEIEDLINRCLKPKKRAESQDERK